MNMNPEYQLHQQIADYLKYQYPKVLFRSDHSGVKVSIGVARKMKALQPREPMCRGFLDLFIYKAKKGYHGMALEIKLEKKSYPSIEQLMWIKALAEEGFFPKVVRGFEHAKLVIDDYLK